VQEILNEASPGETFSITLSFLEPKILAQNINDDLFSATLSESSITCKNESNSRDSNLQLSCKAIDGYIIKPGETFSFVKALGTISADAGYTEAPICSNNNSTLGGGISQTASALYHCVLHADLEVVEHHNHNYVTDFIELGLDAYVDGSTKDLRFRNNTDSPICIEASVNRHTVSVRLIGSQTLSYRVSIRSEITDKQLPLTTYQMLIPGNSQGYCDGDVITKGIEGYQVAVYKEKTDLSTGELLSTKAISTEEYKKRDEVIARIGIFEEDVPPQQEEPTNTP
jgi:vancomycin resistance protein YoaR